MNNPPKDWQQNARAAMLDAFDEMMKWTSFIQAVRIALLENDYQAFLDALAWLHGEEEEA